VETAPRTLLLVSRLPRNLQLLAEFLGKAGYATFPMTSYEEFDQALTQPQAFAGGLIDIAGFDAEIWARCERLRAARIPFLIFSPKHSVAIQQASLSHGAKGIMVKPLVVKELIEAIQSILEDW
jgi:DNA-binding response OmpR family regulator